jgi:hypothetical protein
MEGANAFVFLEPTATPTPVPGGRLLVLTPAAQDTGWVVSDDESIVTRYDPQNHFGDSFLYAGVWGGKDYHAAIQFDLGRIPRGTQIYAAGLRLTGLREDQLSQAGGGVWQVQFLSPELDYIWRNANYEQIQRAAIWSTFEPPLTQEELGQGQVNLFEFTPEQIALLERRVLEGSDRFGRQVSFRLDGPTEGGDNLFAWDSGYGPISQAAAPELFLSLGPPPLKHPSAYYVVITSTPTPENIVTAVANSLRMTAEATRFGTATPLPPNWVTPAVVTATPTPKNQATAQAMAELATAIALTTGEPPNMVTATPTPTPRPGTMQTATPTPVLDTVSPSASATPEAKLPATLAPTLSIPTGTFTLLNPVTFDNPSRGPTDFVWRWIGPVPAGFGFEVRVWRQGEAPAGVHDSVLDNQNGNIKRIGENEYSLRVDITNTPGVRGRSGEYWWTVVLVQISPGYADLKQQAWPARLYFSDVSSSNDAGHTAVSAR